MAKVKTPHLLVVGGTGFIGHHLLASVRKQGWLSTSISMGPPIASRRIEGVRYLVQDLTERDETRRVLGDKGFGL